MRNNHLLLRLRMFVLTKVRAVVWYSQTPQAWQKGGTGYYGLQNRYR